MVLSIPQPDFYTYKEISMMKPSSLLLAVSGCFVSMFLIQSQDTGAEPVRWGIVTKTTVPQVAKPADRMTPGDSHAKAREYVPSAAENGEAVPSEKPDRRLEEMSALSRQGAASQGDSPEPTSVGPGKVVGESGKQTTAVDTTMDAALQPPRWTDQALKEKCHSYLEQMRALFLKTRHYSIQGASCETAEHATAFLEISQSCEGECPEGLIEGKGYSDRILRNIRYLEKLGIERCGARPIMERAGVAGVATAVP